MTIVCDVCWIVLGKTNQVRRVGEEELCFIGIWEICRECEHRISDQIFEDVKSKRYRKN